MKNPKFPADGLFNLSSDGPNVNKTIWKRMNEALEEKKMGTLIASIPCNLYVVHNSFWEGLNLYGTQTEELAFDLHYWFKRSPCKHEDSLICKKTLNWMITSSFDMYKQDGALLFQLWKEFRINGQY